VSAVVAILGARTQGLNARTLVGWLRGYLDLVLVAVAVAYLFLSNVVSLPGLPKGDPVGYIALGLVQGIPLALQAVGIVLVLRSNRIINFAQIAIGGFSAFLFYELMHHSQFLALVKLGCEPCLRGVSNDYTFNQSHGLAFTQALVNSHQGAWLAANFWISLVLSFAVAPLLAFIVYIAVIARFSNAPRLIVTVATVAVTEVLGSLIPLIRANVFQDGSLDPPGLAYQPLPRLTFGIGGILFHADAVLMVGASVLVLGGIAAFLVFSSTGVAIRASAENGPRAGTLGISVNRLAGVVWVLAGALSATAALTGVFTNPTALSKVGGVDAALMVQILIAVVFARMTNIPIAVIAALLVGIVDQALFANFNSSVPFQIGLVALIALSLLLQRGRQSRAEQEGAADYLAAREARPIPKELRHIGIIELWVRWLSIAGVVAVVGFPFVMSPGQVTVGAVVITYSIVGLSLLVLTGWAGQISLGQFAFAAAGAFVAAFLRGKLGLDVTLCLAAGAVAGAVLAVLVGLPAIRLQGLHLAITTLAFALAVQLLVAPAYLGKFLPSQLDRPYYLGFNMEDEKVYYYYCLAFLLLAIGMVVGLRRSRTARALIALRDNEEAAQSFGINLVRARLSAFALSGFMAAFAGGLFAFSQHGVEANSFTADQSISMFLMVVIGGLGSVAGPLVGSVYHGVFLLVADPAIAFLFTGLGVLATLLLFPGGLAAVFYDARDAMLRRVALRRRIVVPSLVIDVRAEGDEDKAAIAPRLQPDGSTAFVPERYALHHQWVDMKRGRHG
jgi:branched-chain amino acid transport system permease protein